MTFLVYTALTGNYEEINDNLPKEFPEHRFICVTDDPKLESSHWEIVYTKPTTNLNSKDLSRHIKMKPQVYLPASSSTLYIDNTVDLSSDPLVLHQYLCRDSYLGLIRHSFHETLEDEIRSIRDNRLANERDLINWCCFALNAKKEFLESKVYWGGIIARKPSPEVEIFGHRWWLEYVRSPGRDQLTLPLVVESCYEWVNVVDLDNMHSDFHKWPNEFRKKRPAAIQKNDPSLSSNSLDLFISNFNKDKWMREITLLADSLIPEANIPFHLKRIRAVMNFSYNKARKCFFYFMSKTRRIYSGFKSWNFLLKVFLRDPKKYLKKILREPGRIIKVLLDHFFR